MMNWSIIFGKGKRERFIKMSVEINEKFSPKMNEG
jgi:hypothetical protein